MKKLGIEALSCTHAAEQTGPCALCGAITPKCASTISAILRAANSPPRFSGSGCRIFTTSCLSNSANCCFVERLSPVAMGTGLRRATSTMAGMLVCGTGSSNHVGRNWWMASANSTAVATLKRQCPSISRSTGGPTASRTARMMSTARSKSYRERNRQLEPNGSNLSAVYPRAATSLAFAAKLSGGHGVRTVVNHSDVGHHGQARLVDLAEELQHAGERRQVLWRGADGGLDSIGRSFGGGQRRAARWRVVEERTPRLPLESPTVGIHPGDARGRGDIHVVFDRRRDRLGGACAIERRRRKALLAPSLLPAGGHI